MTTAPAVTVEPAWRKIARIGRYSFCAGVGALVVAVVILAHSKTETPVIMISCFAPALLVFALGGVLSVIALVRMALTDDKVGYVPPLLGIGVALMSALGAFIAFAATFGIGMSRGRQIRRNGKVILPPLGPGGAWAALPMDAAVPADSRAALADRWRENGRTEHASVAAFARLTLDLMALGAPPELINSANLDARDEIRHTELCFSLAKALDGRDISPGAFPQAQFARNLPSNRTMALARLAVESLIDGALHEGLSARIIAQLAKHCEDADIRSMLQELAADEGRHSAHGWDVVEWCLAEGGAPVAWALRGAVAMLPEHPATDLPPEARDGAWEVFGIHGAAMEEEQHRRSRAYLIERVKTMTGKEESPQNRPDALLHQMQ